MTITVRRAGADEYGNTIKVLLTGDPGAGKGLTLDTPMLTPTGWVPMADVAVDTVLVGRDGTPTTVTAVYDRGVQPVYQVTFDDGASVTCDGDHLWAVETLKTHYTSGTRKVMSTAELVEHGVAKQRPGRRDLRQFFVPLVAPVQFDKVELPVDPYLLGALLANGGLTDSHCVLTTNDTAVVDTIRQRCPEVTLRETTVEGYCRRWAVCGMQPSLRALGLDGKKSGDKFVPPQYLVAHEDARHAILAGLYDCDGSRRGDNRRPIYYTTSTRLRDDVVALVRSLGGVTRVSVDGRDVPCWQVSIMGIDVGWLPRKAVAARRAWRSISAIESVGNAPTRCLTVDAPDELFVTKDFVVTHNTRLSSTFPHPFYANIEGGLMSVADRQAPYATIEASSDLLELLMVLRQSPKVREQYLKVPVDTIIIDTLDSLQKMLSEERKASEKKETMAIQDWGWLGDQLRLVVRQFRNLPMNVVFTCHLRSEQDAETGQTFVRPALQGAMGDEMPAYVDLAVLLKAQPVIKNIDGRNERVLRRVMQTGPDARHPWLKDRSGKLPLELDVDLTSDYSRLRKLIFGDPIPASTQLGEMGQLDTAPSTKVEAPKAEPPKAEAPKARTAAKAKAEPKPADVKPESRPVAERAGTKIDHSTAQPVVFERDGKQITAGLIDPRQRLYQFGGDISKLILWKDRLMGLGIEEWKACIDAGVTSIEVIDSVKNQCWRTTSDMAVIHGRQYDAGAGPRWGIPLEAFDVVDATGWVTTEHTLRTEASRLGKGTHTDADADGAVDGGGAADPVDVEQALTAAEPALEAPGHEVPAEILVCEVCAKPITGDEADISWLRLRKRMCRTDFIAAKTKK